MKFALFFSSVVVATTASASALFGLFESEDDSLAEPASAAELTSQEQQAAAINQRAAQAATEGNSNRAQKLFEETIENFPFTEAAGTAYFEIGRLEAAEGNYPKAIEAYQAVIERYPNSPHFNAALEQEFSIAEQARLGEIKTNFLGIPRNYNTSDIISWYRNVINAAPRSDLAPASLLALGYLYAEDGQRSPSANVFQQLVRDYPDSEQAPEAQLALAEVIGSGHSGQNGEERTLARQQEALEDFELLYGDASELADEARERLRAVESRQAANDLEIAQFYEKKGNLRAAAIYYREVLRYPDSPEYAQASAKLDAMGITEGPLGEGVAQTLTATEDMRTSQRPDYVGPPAPQLQAADTNTNVLRLDEDLLNLPDLPATTTDGIAEDTSFLFGEETTTEGEETAAEEETTTEQTEGTLEDAQQALEQLRQNNQNNTAEETEPTEQGENSPTSEPEATTEESNS